MRSVFLAAMASIEDLASAEVLGLALAWTAEGRRTAVATVTAAWGSAPRRPGSRLLVDAEGNFAGSVSGGCIENAVILEAQAAIVAAEARELQFGVSDEEAWEVGLACGGDIHLFVAPVGDAGRRMFSRIRDAQSRRQALVCATNLENGKASLLDPDDGAPGKEIPQDLADAAREARRLDRPSVEEVGGVRHFVEPFNPPPRLVVVGAVHIAQALVRIAPLLGFETFVVDPRDSWARADRFPGVKILCEWPQDALPKIGIDSRTAVAMLTHDPKIDDPALRLALAARCPYVGALGSARTHARRLERLEEEGIGSEDRGRIHAPIGLDIGAANPAEIAVAVVAEIVAAFRGRTGVDGEAVP